MKRFLKWLAALAVLVVLLVVGAAVAVRIFLSSEQVKLLAASYGEEALARKVRIDRLEVGLFSAEAGGIVIEGKESIESSSPPPLIRIEQVKLRLNPVALIYKRLSISEVKVRGVSLNAKRDAKGRFSFQDILDRLGEQSAPRAGRAAGRRRAAAFSLVSPAEAAEGAPAGDGLALSNMDLLVRSLVIEDVALRMDAAAAAGFPAYQVECQFSRFVARNIRAGAPIDAEVRGECAKPAALQFDVHVVADPGKKDFFISSSFQPFPLAPFAPLVPAEAQVRNLSGTIGGKLQISVSKNGDVGWNVSLKGQEVKTEVQPERGQAWHPLLLGDLDIQSVGRVDAQNGTARVTRLDIELPFAKAQLKKASVFNVDGKDEISLRLDVSDLSIVAVLVKALGGPSLGAFGENRKARFSLAASRDRRKEKGGLKFALTGNFDPLEIGPLAALLPPQETLRAPRGLFGGELDISLDETQKAKWRVKLTGEGLAAQVRPSPAEEWKPLRLSNLAFRSTGHFDMEAMAAEVSELEMTVPFAALRMTDKGLWNISNRDEIHLQVSVSKPVEAVAFARPWLPFPVEGVRSRGKVEARLDLLRDRTKGEAFTYSLAGKIDPVDVGPFVRLSPSADNVRGVTGWVDGDVSFSFTPGKEVSWRVDIAGQQLQGEVKPKSRTDWRKLRLPNLTLRSQGQANLEKGTVVLSGLEAKLPFARVRLPAPASWNLDGKDEVRLDIEVADVGLALDMAGAILDLPMEKMPKGKKLTASVFALRNRRTSDVFAYSSQATFDPLQLKLFSPLLPEGSGVRKLGGTVGGNLNLSFSREEVAQWRISLTGKDIAGDFRPKGADAWKPFRWAQLSVQTAGKYDFPADSGEMEQLKVELPFLKVSSTKKMLWNYRSQDELPVSVTINDIAKALALASIVDKDAVPGGVEVGGELRGNFVLRRNRAKENRFAATGDIRANLRHVRFSDYPNMETAGAVLARLDGQTISVFVPQAVLRQRGREKESPEISLKNLRISLMQENLLKEKYHAKEVLVDELNVNAERGPVGKNNLQVMLMKREEVAREARSKAGGAARPAPAAPGPPGKGARPAAGKPPAPSAKEKPLPPEVADASMPDLKIGRLEIRRMHLLRVHRVEERLAPIRNEWTNLNLLVENLDTRMKVGKMDTLIQLSGVAKPATLFLRLKTNFGVTPLPLVGAFSLRQYELRKLSSYAEHSGGIQISSGQLDFDSEFSVRQKFLRLNSKAKVYRLRVLPARGRSLSREAEGLAQDLVLRFLEREKGEIPVSFKLERRLDELASNGVGQLVVETLLKQVWKKLTDLSGKAGDLVGKDLKGVLKGLGKKSPKAKDVIKELGKELERGLQDILRR